MKRFSVIMTILFFSLFGGAVFASDKNSESLLRPERASPSCVLMRFMNATRFKSLDSESVFADLVMEKLLKSKRFHITEMQPISEEMETSLYDGKKQTINAIRESEQKGDLGALFQETKTATISSAKMGQRVNPSVTSEIGRRHGADYLIHGTIVGIESNRKAQIFWGTKYAIISVTADIRVIRADTGEVVWLGRAVGSDEQKSTEIRGVQFGRAKLNSNLYSRAMEDAAEKLVSSLIADMDARRIFFRR